MISDYYSGRSQDIKDLRESSKGALSLSGFSNHILWIGVFGSFCRNEQTDRSDVDIVVIQQDTVPNEPNDKGYEPWTLEDLLPRVWSRPVEIIYLTQELHELVAIDSLLTSRTVYGDENSAQVLRLRGDARKYLDQGWKMFRTAQSEMETLKSRIAGVRDFEEFIDSPSHQQSFRNELLRVLSTLNILPASHPIYEGFWSAVIQPANEIKGMVDTETEEDHDYWRKIWDILSTSSPKSLQSLLVRLKKFVFPNLEDLERRIKLSEELENKPRMETHTVVEIDSTLVPTKSAERPVSKRRKMTGSEEGRVKKSFKGLIARFTNKGR